VSAGVYGWAMNDVARIAIGAVRAWAQEPPSGPATGPDLVRFVLFSDDALAVFARECSPQA